MTVEEARMIAVMRIHFGCSFSKLAGLARAVWGEDHCRKMSKQKAGYGSVLGEALIKRMEETLGLAVCESDKMVLVELVCMQCKHTQWSICYQSDTEKECENYGKMAANFSLDNGEYDGR